MYKNKYIILCCSVGLLLRALYIVYFNSALVFPDEERFWFEAMSLLHDGAFRSEHRLAHDMPLTAIVIAAFVKLTGSGVVGVKLLFASLSSLTIYLIAVLAGKILPAKRSGEIAATIAAFYPFFIFYSSLVLSETLFLFLVTLVFVLLVDEGKKHYFGIALVLGLAHLTRPTLFYFLPVIALWLMLTKRATLPQVMLAGLVFFLLILPWGVRNYHALGSFHLTTTGSGHVLWEGNNPFNQTGGVAGDFEDERAHLRDIPSGIGELEREKWKKEKAVSYIKDNPERFLSLSVKRFIRFWHLWPNTELYHHWGYKLLSIISFGSVLLLFLLSPFILYAQRNIVLFIFAFTGYYTLIHAITIGSIRYRLPLEPLMIALAAATLCRLWLSWSKEKYQ